MRLCPICDTKTEGLLCPNDGYQTIDLAVFHDDKATDPYIGRVLANRYRILRRLGSGGMGSVYLGLNIPLKQDVAVKVMFGELARDMNAVKRFHREALTTSRLSHPNTVRVFDFGQEPDGLLFLVMEFVKGMPLSGVISKMGRIPPPRVLTIARQVLGALAEAHAAGIVHRDLKPQNIMMIEMPGADDFAKVVDFGIAKIASATGETSLTKTGMSIGSPTYMSPEQAEGKSIDHRSDLYSLGVILYEMLTGRPPFLGETPLAVLVKHMTEPPPLLPADVPQRLAHFVMNLLEKKPAMRPQTAEEALAHLEAPDILSRAPSADGGVQPASREFEVVPAAFPRTDPVPVVPTIAVEMAPAKKKRVLPWIAGSVLAGGVVLVALAVGLSGGDQELPGQPVVSSTPASVVPLPVAAPEPVQAGPPSPVAAPPAKKSVIVRTEPPGALVREGSIVLGISPVTLELEEGRSRTLTAQKDGFKEETAVIDAQRPEVTVRLSALLPAASPQATPSVKPKSGPAKTVRKKPKVELFE